MLKPLEEIVLKYGWKVEEKEPNKFYFSNRNNKEVFNVFVRNEKYNFYNCTGLKLLSGRGQLTTSLEKLLTDYYYAKLI